MLSAPLDATVEAFSYVAAHFVSDALGTLFEAPVAFLFPLILEGFVAPVDDVVAVRNLITDAIDPPPPARLSRLVPATTTPKTIVKTVTPNVTPALALNTTGVKKGTKPTVGTTTPAATHTRGHRTAPRNLA